MGMADLILAGEGDLYDINEYHMLAHLIINKVDDFGTILAQSVHEDVVLYILVLCVSYMARNTLSRNIGYTQTFLILFEQE